MGRLFASMGRFYAWATPEYLLWKMTIGQVILMHNKAVEIRTPKDQKAHGTTLQSAEDVRRVRSELRAQYGAIDGTEG